MADLERRYGIHTTYDLDELVRDADMIIFAVKPKDAGEALMKIQPYLNRNVFFISVMAGISINFIENKIKADCAIAKIHAKYIC